MAQLTPKPPSPVIHRAPRSPFLSHCVSLTCVSASSCTFLQVSFPNFQLMACVSFACCCRCSLFTAASTQTAKRQEGSVSIKLYICLQPDNVFFSVINIIFLYTTVCCNLRWSLCFISHHHLAPSKTPRQSLRLFVELAQQWSITTMMIMGFWPVSHYPQLMA